MAVDTQENKALYLIKKGKRGFFRLVFSRLGIIFLLLLLQLSLLGGMFRWFEEIIPLFWSGNILFSASMVLYLTNHKMDASAKITWLLLIMVAPVFGGLLLIYIERDTGNRVLKARLNDIIRRTDNLLEQKKEVTDRLKEDNYGIYSLTKYVQRSGCFPVHTNTDVTYFPSGEEKWKVMLEQLEQAKEFIFLEYFIVEEGEMWGKILDILVRKAKEGVEVRVMYDGTCELSTLPHNYPKMLRNHGISCKMFAPLTPFLSTHYNYRDHRKILVIDGKVAFNGGVNLADEYINYVEKYGHWKDTAVMLRGEAVDNFTLMFLQMWNVDERNEIYEPYMNKVDFVAKESGYVMPFGDSPLDYDKVGERLYMDILNRAHKRVYIMSPYLILDGEMETAIKFAAERGVDVKLILPGIPDKEIPYALAKTHYTSLLDSGVEIYEYTKGFVHAKVWMADDIEGVVGTINLDYRSLYHHFECATYLYNVSCISKIKEDFEHTLEECKKVTYDTIKQEKKIRKLIGHLAKTIAPLM